MDRPTAAAGITPGSQIMCAFKLLAGRDGSADRPVDRPMDHTPSGGCSANANRSALRLVRRDRRTVNSQVIPNGSMEPDRAGRPHRVGPLARVRLDHQRVAIRANEPKDERRSAVACYQGAYFVATRRKDVAACSGVTRSPADSR